MNHFPFEGFSPDQRSAIDSLADWVGGYHHLPKVHGFGRGVCINTSKDLATFDFDGLTRLVLIAHRDAVRMEIESSGPKMVKVIAHKRQPLSEGLRFWEMHPTLENLQSSIAKLEEGAAK